MTDRPQVPDDASELRRLRHLINSELNPMMTRMEADLDRVTDERDRLRAIVDAQRDAIAARDVYIWADTNADRDAAAGLMAKAKERLEQLDVSPDTGGEA